MNKHPDTILFTIATAGFVPFVRNLQASLARLGLGRELTVYALDDVAFEELSADGLTCVRHEADGLRAWSDFKTPAYGKTMCHKYAVGLEILATGRYALYMDSDIVFLRDPLAYLHTLMADSSANLLMQWEAPTNVFNAGFWLARPSAPIVRLFQETLVSLQNLELTEDQAQLNRILARTPDIGVVGLNPDLFACANRFDVSVHFGWRTNLAPLSFDFDSAYLLHFNYLAGRDAKVRSLIRNRAVFWPDVLAGHTPGHRGSGLVLAETVQQTVRRLRRTVSRALKPQAPR